jgi:hypothetical protein
MNKKGKDPIRETLPWFGPGMVVDPDSMASFLKRFLPFPFCVLASPGN